MVFSKCFFPKNNTLQIELLEPNKYFQNQIVFLNDTKKTLFAKTCKYKQKGYEIYKV